MDIVPSATSKKSDSQDRSYAKVLVNSPTSSATMAPLDCVSNNGSEPGRWTSTTGEIIRNDISGFFSSHPKPQVETIEHSNYYDETSDSSENNGESAKDKYAKILESCMKKRVESFISPKEALKKCFMDIRRAKASGEFKRVTNKPPMFNPDNSLNVFKLKPPIDMEAVDDSTSTDSECDATTTSAAPKMDDSIEPYEGIAIFKKITSDSSRAHVDDEDNIFYFNFNP